MSTVSGAVRDEDSVSDEDFWAEERAKAMTVQQLIDLLATVDDKTLPVLSDGCDCWGEADGVRLVDAGGGWMFDAVLIERAKD